MPRASYMLYLKIWLLIYQLTSKFPVHLQDRWLHICLQYICSDLFFFWNGYYADMCCTSLLMRMFRWDHGLLDWMQNTQMTGDYVVAPHLVSFISLWNSCLNFFSEVAKSFYDISANFGKEVDFCQLSGCTLEKLNR